MSVQNGKVRGRWISPRGTHLVPPNVSLNANRWQFIRFLNYSSCLSWICVKSIDNGLKSNGSQIYEASKEMFYLKCRITMAYINWEVYVYQLLYFHWALLQTHKNILTLPVQTPAYSWRTRSIPDVLGSKVVRLSAVIESIVDDKPLYAFHGQGFKLHLPSCVGSDRKWKFTPWCLVPLY